MTKPIRVQRRRTRGWKMPENTVFVGRPSRWGNPFVIGQDGTAREVVRKYHDMVNPYRHRAPNNGLDKLYISIAQIEDIQHALRGKNLACWCKLECQACAGTGRKYETLLSQLAENNITPPIIDGACPQCAGSGKQPCHADILLEIANDFPTP